jgi:hypothetical protein
MGTVKKQPKSKAAKNRAPTKSTGRKGPSKGKKSLPNLFGPTERAAPMTTVASSYFTDGARDMGRMAMKPAPPAEEHAEGTRVTGCDYIANVGYNTGSNDPFAGYPAGGNNQGDALVLNPFNFKRLASIAANFTKFIFREICWEYIPLTGTTTSGGWSFAHEPDGANLISPSLSNLMQYGKNFVTPWWKPACLTIKFIGKTLYWIDQNSQTSTSAQRQTNQGVMLGATDNASPGSTTVNGMLCAKYVCDFYGSQVTAGSINLLLLTGDERKVIRELRESKGKDTKTSDGLELFSKPSYRDVVMQSKPPQRPSTPEPQWLEVGRSLRAPTELTKLPLTRS